MYLVIETVNEQEYQPAYDYHEKGGYTSVIRTNVLHFADKSALIVYLSKDKRSNCVKRDVYEAKEVFPKKTITVDISV